jgi:thymidylate kinase
VGILVNFEAIDRGGKSTAHPLVVARLRADGRTVTGMSFPDRPSTALAPSRAHFPTGLLIDRYLRGLDSYVDEQDALFSWTREDGRPVIEIDTPERAHLVSVLNEKIAQTLFSLNRRELTHGPEGLQELMGSYDVVLTLRALSAWTYGVVNGVSELQLATMEGDLPQPDLNILIDIDPAVAAARRSDDAKDRYEANESFQRRVRARYLEIVAADADHAEAEGRLPRYLLVDGTLPAEAIADAAYTEILRRLA